jgi:hypothetical protein
VRWRPEQCLVPGPPAQPVHDRRRRNGQVLTSGAGHRRWWPASFG